MKIALILLVLLFQFAHANAQPPAPCEPSPEAAKDEGISNRIRQLVKEKQFAAVEDELGDRLLRQERGEYSDLSLYKIAVTSMRGDASTEPLLQEWVNRKPELFVARLLKGAHHLSAGSAKRGTAFADKTSVEQFSAMEAEYRKGVAELKIAMDLRSRSALPHALLIGIARSIAGPDSVRGLLAESERLDPRNLAARYVASHALDPRWGGSLEDLDALVARALKSPLPEARQRFLQYEIETIKAEHFREITKEKTKALAHYRRAAAVCASGDALWGASTMAYDLEDWPTVIEVVDAYVALRPAGAGAMQRRGWAKEKLGRVKEAARDYEVAASAGEAWSQNKLGYLLMTGTGVPRDRERARQLFEAAVAKGYAQARTNLDWLNRQPAAK